MAAPDQVVAKSAILLKAAAALGLPVTISEQYPKGPWPHGGRTCGQRRNGIRETLLLLLARWRLARALHTVFTNMAASR